MHETNVVTLRKFLRLPDVMQATGMRRSAVLEAVKLGTFPAPMKIGERAVAWDAEEIAAWQAARLADRFHPTKKTKAFRKF